MWKILDEAGLGNMDYVGFNHYRRMFDPAQLVDLERYDAVVAKPHRLNFSVFV